MSRKLVVTLVLILLILPFVSWYYLQSGLNWRKEAQLLMSGNEPFPAGEWLDHADKTFNAEMTKDHVSIVTLVSCDRKNEISVLLNEFYSQFLETKKANFLILDPCESNMIEDSSKLNWHVFPCKDSTGLCQKLSSSWPAGKTYALVDRDNVIRSYYSANTTEEKRLLLEHMALLLPRERSEKVELKRGNRR